MKFQRFWRLLKLLDGDGHFLCEFDSQRNEEKRSNYQWKMCENENVPFNCLTISGNSFFSDLFYFIFHLWVPCLFQNLWKRLKESGRKTIELFITSVLDKNVDIASQIRSIYSAYLKSYFEDVAFFVCQIESLYHQIKQSLNIF